MLEDLYQLQQLELAKEAACSIKQKSPEYQELKAVREQFLKNKSLWQSLEHSIIAEQKLVKSIMENQELLKAKLDKENASVYDGSTSTMKELEARELQINAIKEQLLVSETELAEAKNKVADLIEQLHSVKEILTQEHDHFEELRGQLQQLDLEQQAKVNELEVKIEQYRSTLDPKELTWFDKEKRRHHGSPIAYLDERHVCSGCQTIVPPMVFIRADKRQETACDKCGRRLFVRLR